MYNSKDALQDFVTWHKNHFFLVCYDRSSRSAGNSSNKYKSRYLLKKKSDAWLSTLPLNHSWGTAPDPNLGMRWQVWMILFMQMIEAFGQCHWVNRDSLNIPNCVSHVRNSLNQCTYVYASGSEDLPNCVGSLKITRISATQRPVVEKAKFNK